MTRIGLFIIPLAGERKRERAREGDKADKKKCVVAGPARHLPTGSNGRQPMHAYHFHGYQRGLLSGDFTIKTASTNPVQRAKHAFNSEVTVSVNLANQNQGQHKKNLQLLQFLWCVRQYPERVCINQKDFFISYAFINKYIYFFNVCSSSDSKVRSIDHDLFLWPVI